MTPQHSLWIENLSERLHLPIWGGALVFQGVLAVLFPSVFLLAGAWNQFLTTVVYFVLPLLALGFAFALLTVYVRNQMQSLEEYAFGMVKERVGVSDKLSSLSSFKAILIVNLLFNLAADIPFALSGQGGLSLGQNLVVSFFPWVIAFLPISTVLWIWGYSMVGLYRIGKLEMNLQSFALDRTLGLKPFASVSLRLTAIYYSYVAIQITVDTLSVGFSPIVIVRDGVEVFFGLVVFFLPLSSIHAKLVRSKLEESAWLSMRYANIVKRIKSNGDGPLDEDVQRELLSIDKMQKDVHAIRSWPFDTNALAKLVTIVLSLSAILLSKFLSPIFGLH